MRAYILNRLRNASQEDADYRQLSKVTGTFCNNYYLPLKLICGINIFNRIVCRRSCRSKIPHYRTSVRLQQFHDCRKCENILRLYDKCCESLEIATNRSHLKIDTTKQWCSTGHNQQRKSVNNSKVNSRNPGHAKAEYIGFSRACERDNGDCQVIKVGLWLMRQIEDQG